MKRRAIVVVLGATALASGCGEMGSNVADNAGDSVLGGNTEIDIDAAFEAGIDPTFLVYSFGELEPAAIESAAEAADEIRSSGRTPIVKEGSACFDEPLALDVETGDVLRDAFAAECDEKDPYIAIFVDVRGE